MKALLCTQFGSIEDLALIEVEPPPLGDGQVRISVKAAGLNYPDGLVVEGKYQLKPPLPFSPGSEFAGVILEVADDVDEYHVGERVFGLTSFGAFAEELVIPIERLQRMDNNIDFATASVLSMAYGAAMYALFDRGELQQGQNILILGATGGVGLAAIELAALKGARIMAVDGDDNRLIEASRKGADKVWNYRSGPIHKAAKEFCGDDGFDVILDPVGGEIGEQAIRALGWRGRYLVFGFASGDIPMLKANLLLLKGAEARGVFWGESQRRHDNNDKANFKQLLSWHKHKKIRPHIGKTFPLKDTPKAMRALIDGKIVGKALIKVDESGE